METLVVACVQQRMRLPDTVDEYRDDVTRFLRIAATKRARLVVFPELAGMMLAPPLLRGFQARLLKQADRAHRRRAGLWQKVTGRLARTIMQVLGTDLRNQMAGLLDVEAGLLWQTYQELYSELAREFDMTLVAPSGYFPDPLDGVIRNLSAVFGPDGDMLDYQAKGMLHATDQDLVQRGTEWRVIATDVGRIGLMIGNDMLYPEVGRVLAYQGAEILIGQATSTNRALYEKLRSAMLARMQENQLFAALSFLVGPNEFGPGPGALRKRAPFIGKSAIFAPQELTPRYSGVLVEMANVRSESVLTGVWDFPALQQLWETSDTPIRKDIPLEQVGPMLARLYQQLRKLPRPSAQPTLPKNLDHTPDGTLHDLDELPVLASVTARWPLQQRDSSPNVAEEEVEALIVDAGESSTFLQAARRQEDDILQEKEKEEETQEMDALLQPSDPGEAPTEDESTDRAAAGENTSSESEPDTMTADKEPEEDEPEEDEQ